MTPKEQEIKGLLVSFYRETREDYMEALNKYTKQITTLRTKTDKQIMELREKFFNQCTDHNQIQTIPKTKE